MDPFHFDTDTDPDPDPLPMITDPDPGRILKVSKFLNLYFGRKNFVDNLCLSENALNTQILEHLEEIS